MSADAKTTTSGSPSSSETSETSTPYKLQVVRLQHTPADLMDHIDQHYTMKLVDETFPMEVIKSSRIFVDLDKRPITDWIDELSLRETILKEYKDEALFQAVFKSCVDEHTREPKLYNVKEALDVIHKDLVLTLAAYPAYKCNLGPRKGVFMISVVDLNPEYLKCYKAFGSSYMQAVYHFMRAAAYYSLSVQIVEPGEESLDDGAVKSIFHSRPSDLALIAVTSQDLSKRDGSTLTIVEAKGAAKCREEVLKKANVEFALGVARIIHQKREMGWELEFPISAEYVIRFKIARAGGPMYMDILKMVEEHAKANRPSTIERTGTARTLKKREAQNERKQDYAGSGIKHRRPGPVHRRLLIPLHLAEFVLLPREWRTNGGSATTKRNCSWIGPSC